MTAREIGAKISLAYAVKSGGTLSEIAAAEIEPLVSLAQDLREALRNEQDEHDWGIEPASEQYGTGAPIYDCLGCHECTLNPSSGKCSRWVKLSALLARADEILGSGKMEE